MFAHQLPAIVAGSFPLWFLCAAMLDGRFLVLNRGLRRCVRSLVAPRPLIMCCADHSLILLFGENPCNCVSDGQLLCPLVLKKSNSFSVWPMVCGVRLCVHTSETNERARDCPGSINKPSFLFLFPFITLARISS